MCRNEPVPIEVIIDDYMNGDTLQIIATRYGVTRQAVQQRLERQGIPRRMCQKQIEYATCPTCNEQFIKYTKEQRYCSHKCARPIGQHIKSHCKNGHPLIEENLYPRYRNTPPRCKLCSQAKVREWNKKNRKRKSEENPE